MSALMEQDARWREARARLGVVAVAEPGAALGRTMIARMRATIEEKASRINVLEAKVAGLEDNIDKLTHALAAEMLKKRKAVPVSVSAAIEAAVPVPVKDRWTIIISQVADKHGVTVTDLRSERRDKKTYVARHECFWRLKKETTLSIARIGHLMGHKDHTSVIHGIHRHEQRIALGEAI